MASFRDLQLDWSMLCQECPECWTPADLQLAAELGKTLLERNKELEVTIKQHQNVIEDQVQEIEYLTKQTAALREVSDSRLRIYEQLEVSIQDLERANHRLVLDNSAGKKHIKTLTTTIENLEAKCEDLQTTIDDLRLQADVLKRKAQRNDLLTSTPTPTNANRVHLWPVESYHDESVEDDVQRHNQTHVYSTPKKKTDTAIDQVDGGEKDEEQNETNEQLAQLLSQLREVNTQSSRDQRRITELEEQLAAVLQQNRALESQVTNLHHHPRDEDMKSMYDELNTLEEVRKGQMCSRCLRNVEKSGDDSHVLEDDNSSMLEELMNTSQHRASFALDVQARQAVNELLTDMLPTKELSIMWISPSEYASQSSPESQQTGNLYKDLVEKYEALLEVHRQPSRPPKKRPISLQEELHLSSSDFTAIKDTDDESGNGDSLKPEQPHKPAVIAFSHTPTDFSEAETSSSGFADETSNKCTQTEPGSALADADDGRVSIYDDASAIANRFRARPEYQQLFTEIFAVLKNAQEAKGSEPVRCTLINSVREEAEIVEDEEDTQSVVSSVMSEVSVTRSERVEEERTLRPLVRPPLEYLSVEVRKRAGGRRRARAERSASPAVTHIIGSPKISYGGKAGAGRKRREFKGAQEAETTWNGSTVQFWSSNRAEVASPTPSQGSGIVFKPSVASQELHKLKKLDLSYADVVRKADSKKRQKRHK